jgi:hypothetical protein
MRSPFLVHLSTTRSRKGKTSHSGGRLMSCFRLDDDDEDDFEDDDDIGDDEGDEDDEEEDDEEEEETWQVTA